MLNATQLHAADAVLAAVETIGYETTEDVVKAYAGIDSKELFDVAVDFLLETGLLWPSATNAIGGRVVPTLRLERGW